MSRRCWFFVATGVLTWATLLSTPAMAAELLGLWKKPYTGPAPVYARQPSRAVAVPPGHQRYYAYNEPDYPWYNNGLGVPTYNWGFFGARYRPAIVGDHPYYNMYSGFSFRPGD
jgi:hypothetical protein